MSMPSGVVCSATRRVALVAVGLSLAAGTVLTPRGVLAKPVEGVGSLVSVTRQPGTVAKFVAPDFSPADDVATFALLAPPAAAGELPAAWRTRPTFERLADGRHQVRVAIDAGTSLYGTGEVTGPLLRNGREVVLWNSDVPGYQPTQQSLYQSHPWVFAVRADGSAFGVLVDTTFRTTINLDGAITFTSSGLSPRVYIVERPDPLALTNALAELTGYMPMPPRWAVGYHQCRWSYNPESRVREVAKGFRDRNIPASVFWFDIDYMDGFRTFTFDKAQFPDPKKLNADLEAQGWKSVWMINPGVKNEAGYFVRDQMVSQGLYVRNADGSMFTGEVWPGVCVFPDFTRADTRAWWGTLYKDFMAMGIDGVWNDMNEPAVFNSATKLMDETALHAGGPYRSLPGQPEQVVTPGDHSRFHNVYGMLMSQASFEGMLAANPDKRPFLLTRASFLGGHRYAATWTGDNSATWNDLEQSIPMVLNLGLSGQPFVGPDIGGFVGRGPADETERATQFARWMGIGAMLPFARGHTAKGNINKEPWEFGASAEAASRTAIMRRYRMLPYFYTLFHQAHTSGAPVCRPAFFADPTDPALRSEDDVFLVGGDVLVVPQLMPDSTRVPVLPKGDWRAFDLTREQHPDLPTLKLRPGAILPVGPEQQFTDQKPLDPLTLIVNLDEKGIAFGELYEDAGDGFGYKDGDYSLTTYGAERTAQGVRVMVARTEGRRARPDRELIVRVLTPTGVIEQRGRDGKDVIVPISR